MVVITELSAPSFLIAVPQLGDPNFHRGVVLLLEHGDEGTMGLVVNRPTSLTMSDFCESQKLSYKGDGSATVFQGGPVQTERAFILHQSDHRGPETEEVLEAVKLSYSLESLHLIVESPPEQMRVFLGYAGWAPGQLAEEISQGAWLLTQPDPRLIFDPSYEGIWERALRDMGIEPAQLVHSDAVH